MLMVTVLTASWVVRRFKVPFLLSSRQLMGGFALALMVVAEFGLVLWIRGISISEYFANRDPASGTVYYVMLGVFAAMPLLVARK